MTRVQQVHVSLPQLQPQNISKVRSFTQCYRAGGPKVVHELINDKHIFHNYGFGAAAPSLAYGSSHMSAKSYSIYFDVTASDGQCAVLGAGVMGLMTALGLIKGGRRVTVYSQALPELDPKESEKQIVSQVSPSVWLPSEYDWSEDMLKHELFSKLAYDYYRESVALHRYQGLKEVTVYDNSRQPQDLKEVVSSYVCDIFKAAEIGYDSGEKQAGSLYKSVYMDCTLFLEELRIQAILRGVRFVEKRFDSLQDVLGLKEAAIWNCTNAGSSYLFQDSALKQQHYLMVAFDELAAHKHEYVLKSALKGEPEFELHCLAKKTTLIVKTKQRLREKHEINSALSTVEQALNSRRLNPKL